MNSTLDRDKALYDRMKSGDDSAREDLILNYMPLVHMHASMIANSDDMFDELVSEGYIELIRCVDAWEFRGKILKAYASKCVKLSMWKYIKRRRRVLYNVEPEDIYYIDDEDNEMLDKSLGYVDFNLERKETDEIFERLCEILTPSQKRMMTLLYEKNLKPYEVAESLDLNISNVTTTLKDARERIGDLLDIKELGVLN